MAVDLAWMLDKAVRMRIAGGAFVLWGVSAYLRCLDPKIRRRLATVAALLTAWMLLVIVRWRLSSSTLKTLLWYGYYVPLTFLPLLSLFCAARASGLDRRPWARTAMRALVAVAVGIVALVLTNNVHEQVFRFLSPVRTDEGPYAYNWGHRLVVAWSIACYLGFFLIFAVFSRQRLKRLIVPVVALCLGGVAYSLAYGMQAPWAFELNYSLVYGVLTAVALELCLDLGFIPSALSFTELFDSLPFDLRVLDRDGGTYRATRVAGDLPQDVCERVELLARNPAREGPASAQEGAWDGEQGFSGGASLGGVTFSFASRPEALYHAWPLAGGVALLCQDVTDLAQARQALVARQDELRRINELLEQRRQTELALEGLDAKRALMDDVEDAISSSMGEISHVLGELSASPPRAGEAVDNARGRRRQLERVRMILGYCKRKSSLVLFERADPELDRDRMSLIANELAGDLRAVGIDCAAASRISRAVPAREMSVLFDCIYGFAFVAFACTDPVIMYFLTERPDGMVELRARLGSQDDDDLLRRPEAASLLELLAERDVVYSLVGGPGTLRLVARVRGREVEP